MHVIDRLHIGLDGITDIKQAAELSCASLHCILFSQMQWLVVFSMVNGAWQQSVPCTGLGVMFSSVDSAVLLSSFSLLPACVLDTELLDIKGALSLYLSSTLTGMASAGPSIWD